MVNIFPIVWFKSGVRSAIVFVYQYGVREDGPMEDMIKCHICGGWLLLSRSKTDETGQAVHEECYVKKIKSELNESLLPPTGEEK